MAALSQLLFPAVVAVVLLLLGPPAPTPVTGAPNTAVVSTLCNSAAYTAGDPFATSLAYVLSDLLAVVPGRKGHDYYNISPYPNAFAYGHAACTADLSAGDCSSCLSFAVEQMNSTCGMRIGARSVLVDCTTIYEQYPFVN
ncbi:antifungal protein ginkbilobin-like protein [Canna indica]|uniref:Antifungal protein ginkbilobin-like protein n=1 Tax=Canna indica TaxID=4628 RepID=A0AAQ3Q9I4_9LILI|nr:antifungal protein ginkbilobin-like protein [Canna indica]